ncbi:unnamed protein product [Camellia sinensis]
MLGFVRSLEGLSIERPDVNIEVILGQNKILKQVGGFCQTETGLGQHEVIERIKSVEVGPCGRLSSLSEAQEKDPSNRHLRLRKGKEKEKSSNKRKSNQNMLRRRPFEMMRKYGSRGASSSRAVPKAAAWHAAVVAMSLSASIESGVDKGRFVLDEAEAT